MPYVPGGGARWDDRLESRIAEPGIRIGAKVIDTIFIVILQFIVSFIAAMVFVSSGSSGFASDGGLMFGQNLALTVTVAIVGLVIDAVYNVVLVAAFGGQPGKLLLGLRIVTTDGAKVDAGIAFRRWSPMLLVLALSAIPLVSILGGLARLVLVVANLVMIFADDRRRDVFDHVGGTYVIATR